MRPLALGIALVLCSAAAGGAGSSAASGPPASSGALAETALLEGLRALAPAEREAFWDKLRRAKAAREAGAAQALPAADTPVRRRRAQGGNFSVGACLGHPTPPSLARNGDTGTLDLAIEVDDGSDLNILASHVAKILLEEVIGFRVDLRSEPDSDGAMERLALERERFPDEAIDINMGVMAEAKANVEIYNRLVAEQNLLIDLGPTGYSVQAGWFTQDREADSGCVAPGYIMTYTRPDILQTMLRADAVEPYSYTTGDKTGQFACNASAGRGFCGDNGIYYSKMCNNVTGMSLVDPSRPCRALIAHQPSFEPAVNEQLINNLDLEIGIVYAGPDAADEILQRTRTGETFLFYHWTPSWLVSKNNLTRVQLQQHNWREWDDDASESPDGPISSDFVANPPMKLANAELMDLHPHLKDFLQLFTLNEQHADELLQLSGDVCDTVDSLPECAELHERVACAWLSEHDYLWPSFIPEHAHCAVGEHVTKVGLCSGEQSDQFSVNCTIGCVACPAGQYQDKSSYQNHCKGCPAGSYAAQEGQVECTLCVPGKYTDAINSTSSDSCLDCSVGMYQDLPGMSRCMSCTEGTYQAAVGKTYCDSCTVGQYQPEDQSAGCLDCPANARACRVEMQNGVPKRVCRNQETTKDSCTCDPGHFLGASGKCEACPVGAFCCMCEEIAGCYDSELGDCDVELLRDNMRRRNSTCSGDCVSGSPRPMPMYGYFRIDLSLDSVEHPVLKPTEDLQKEEIAEAPSHTKCCDWMKRNSSHDTWKRDPEFVACNLRLPNTQLRTAVDPDYQGCTGGPSTTCTNGSKGFLCRECEPYHYLAFTGKCVHCGGDGGDGTGAKVLQICLFLFFFFILIPMFFLLFFFSVSDKSANQFMVYPRLLIDLLVVLYLLYSSLFRYWPHELIGYTIHDGRSRVEFFNNLFMECSFDWGFTARYYAYLFMPVIVTVGVLLQIGFVWFLKEYNDSDARLDTVGDDADSADFGNVAVNTGKSSGCLNGLARSIAAKMPTTNTSRGRRIAWAPPQDAEEWAAWKDHARQILLLWFCMLYVTLVNYSLTVYDCSDSNGHVTALGGKGIKFMEEEASIACSMDDPRYQVLLIGCAISTVCYTLALPITLGTVFYRRKDEAKRGEITYMRRYGFLLKPYKNETYYWEIVNISRKALLSITVKLSTHNPTVCASWGMTILFFIIAHQAKMRPYKYEKHNTCAITVLSTSLLNFFSSVVFISDLPTLWQKQVLIWINVALILFCFCWAFFGALHDIYNFGRYFWFTLNCEVNGRAEEEKQVMWEVVDLPGLISLVWYDVLVVRNRYSHTTTRETVLGKESDPATEEAAQKAIEDDELNLLRTQVYNGEAYTLKSSPQSQHEATKAFEQFHKHFARFVARVQPAAVSPHFLDAEQRAGNDDDDGDSESESRSRSRSASRERANSDVDDEDDDDDGGAAVSQDAFLVPPDFDQAKMQKRAELMQTMYTKSTLVYMVLYLEHCIKYGLTAEYNLDKIGAGDLMSQLIQFMQTFVLDAHEGMAREGATADAQARGKNKDLGGWASQEESVGTSRRRGPPAKGPDASPDSTNANDIDSFAPQAEEAREALRRLLKVQCAGCYRPYMILGIDLSQYIDGSEVTGFDTHQAGYMDFASALHGLNHALNSDAFAASAAGAMDFGAMNPMNELSVEDGDADADTE